MEKVNARHPFELEGGEGKEAQVHMVTVDVSFISATKVIPEASRHLVHGGAIIVLLKPQFEAFRNEVGRGGVIKDVKVHTLVLARFIPVGRPVRLQAARLGAQPHTGR